MLHGAVERTMQLKMPRCSSTPDAMRRSLGVRQAKEGHCFLVPFVKTDLFSVEKAYPLLFFALANYFCDKGILDGDRLKFYIAETGPLSVP